MRKPFAIVGPTVITLLLTLSIIPEALAIDVYHFLVQYKNGRIAEKIATHSEERYKSYYEGYVANVVLLNKKEYSLHRFIEAFGERNYLRFTAGLFGFGLEEKIIFSRNLGGLDVNPMVLPPPDKKSKALARKHNRILCNNHMASDTIQLDIPTLPNPGRLSAQIDDLHFATKDSVQRDGVDLPVELHPENPKESDEEERYGFEIVVYRFLAEYINGWTVEKITTQLPEEYHKHYKGYVRKVASLGRKSYKIKEFKRTFGEKNYRLFIQGLFGKDDIDLVMDNRIKRGIAPHQSVLPTPSKESNTLSKKLKALIDNQITRNQ